MVERRIKEAKFPAVKSLDSFDFAAIPSLNKTLVLELARSEYVTRRENIIAVGNSGTGKTQRRVINCCQIVQCGDRLDTWDGHEARLAGLGDVDPPNIRRSISLAVDGLEHRLYPSIEALVEVGDLSRREIKSDKAVIGLFSHHGNCQKGGKRGPQAAIGQALCLAPPEIQTWTFANLVENGNGSALAQLRSVTRERG